MNKPNFCNECGEKLIETKGVVGELILECPEHGIKWDAWVQAMICKEGE